jgi:LPXTG-site transpeptidase (sortase) family protein
MNLISGLHRARLASWLMLGSAFGIFVYVGSNVVYTSDAQAGLSQAWDSSHPSISSSGAAPVLAFQRPRLAYGQPLAKMSVPSISFSGVVLEGTDRAVLDGGPGHVPSSAYPGEDDTVVISNHNAYSLSWGKLQVGELIYLQTNYGTYKYRVYDFKIVDASDRSLTASTRRASLTFITCYPLYAGALAPQRFGVLADMVR